MMANKITIDVKLVYFFSLKIKIMFLIFIYYNCCLTALPLTGSPEKQYQLTAKTFIDKNIS